MLSVQNVARISLIRTDVRGSTRGFLLSDKSRSVGPDYYQLSDEGASCRDLASNAKTVHAEVKDCKSGIAAGELAADIDGMIVGHPSYKPRGVRPI